VADIITYIKGQLDRFEAEDDDHVTAAATYSVDILGYESGQSTGPYSEGIWDYNQAVYDAQIDYGMYEAYNLNFTYLESKNHSLFVAYSYITDRETIFGAWGHLESPSQLSGDLITIAPKYQALLDYISDATTMVSGGSETITVGSGNLTLTIP
jgi:hypothetical protein